MYMMQKLCVCLSIYSRFTGKWCAATVCHAYMYMRTDPLDQEIQSSFSSTVDILWSMRTHISQILSKFRKFHSLVYIEHLYSAPSTKRLTGAPKFSMAKEQSLGSDIIRFSSLMKAYGNNGRRPQQKF